MSSNGTNAAKVKVGVFGGRRGQTMVEVLSHHPDAELVAVCDAFGPALDQCRRLAEQAGIRITCYHNLDEFMGHDMDAVVLANYATEHVPYAVRLLDSGRHVCSENIACQTLGEAVRLVEAVQRSGKVYSYAENCCYFPSVLEMQRLYRRGDIGEFQHGEGEYIHDCEGFWPAITYGDPNHWRNWTPASFYCTHSVGPVLTITGTRPVRLTGYETTNINKRKFGGRSADASIILCQMSNGATAKFMPWANLRREPGGQWFAIYGSEGMMETGRWDGMTSQLHITGGQGGIETCTPEFPVELRPTDMDGGHGGSDYLTMHFFLAAILDRPGKEQAIDVYQALDMTLPGLLGYRSIWEKNAPLDVPDFRISENLDRYRDDNWSADPKLAGPGQPTSCASGPVAVPDSVYEAQAEAYRKSMT